LLLQRGAEPFPGYQLGDRIGRGGFAEVWQAATRDGQQIALKCMPLNNAMIASKEVRSIQELSRLRHPHLTRVHQVWCTPGYIIIAMDQAEGSLHDLLLGYNHEYKSAVPPGELCRYLSQAASAIDFLNARVHKMGTRTVGYQHCDIKPSNILLFGEDARLADYGLATPISQPMTEYVGGWTVDFAAPELFHGRLSERSDQFSLAATYVYLRLGRAPFPARAQHLNELGRRTLPPDLHGLSSAEQSIVARGLDAQPQNRWPSCVLMMSRLTRLFEPIGQKGWSHLETMTD